MDTLATICARKREHIASQQHKTPLAACVKAAHAAPPPRGFKRALAQKKAGEQVGLIAELKKASPSRGLIRADFAADKIATSYESGGATCLSVLTDAPFFQGDDVYLQQAKQACALPVLRKDFMLDAYQIYESRALGADCILLIMAALEDEQAAQLEQIAQDLGMDVLVEVHNEPELRRALAIHPNHSGKLIGINNRNLKTLAVDMATTEALAPMAQGHLLACESGIRSNDDIVKMTQAGVWCFLVGEALMDQKDITAATRKLLHNEHLKNP